MLELVMTSHNHRQHYLTRREFVALGAAGAAALVSPGREPANATTSSPSSQRRLLFNWDGSMIHCFGRAALATMGEATDTPLSREQFTKLVFTPIDSTAVDTVFFSFGSGNVAEYDSRVLEWPGEADGFNFPERKTWHGGIEVAPSDQYRNPKALADSGHNPPAIVVEECRRRGLGVFASLRMNDCHDGQHTKGALPNPEYPTFKRQNPDWLVNDLDWWSALNFAHPRVRALKRRVIEEFFDRWDFDGIELDWLRHTLNFPRGTERDNGHYLTELLRTVRASLNQKAAQRGRPIEIAVRVPERVDWCLDGGYEIGKWIAEDLVDLIILGQGLTEASGIGEFRKLMTARQLPIYPCVYSYGNGYRLSPDEVLRASASNLWQDGADGLYAFNWFYYGDWRRDILSEIASADRLKEKPKHYTLLRRANVTAGQPGADYLRYNGVWKDPKVPIRLTVAGGPHTTHVPAQLASNATQAELWVGVDYLEDDDILMLSWNDKPLDPPVIHRGLLETLGYQISAPPGNGILGFAPNASLDTQFAAVRLPVKLSDVVEGQNRLTLTLKKRSAAAAHELRVTRIELKIA